MKYFRTPSRWRHSLVTWLACAQILPCGCVQFPMGLTQQTDNFEGTIDFSTERVTPFTLHGTEPDIGEYTARGEVLFRPGDQPDSLIGEGVAVFTTTDGSRLAGVVTWQAGPEINGERDSSIEFSWRDSVQFSDGTTVSSDGQFAQAENRPRGLVVIAIIAILIAMLLPAVQKVR
ncbi:MAG TPA: hypothetical protein VJZ71_07325 [Phycisphaerae bacterium]|nr:hypothetical protein [Phycisphaerae bacterium]